MVDLNLEIGRRIAELREEKNESQAKLAGALSQETGKNRLQETIAQWELGDRQIKAKDIVDIANHFGISTDYLLYRTKVKTVSTDTQAICDYTGLTDKTIEALHEQQDESDFTRQFMESVIVPQNENGIKGIAVCLEYLTESAKACNRAGLEKETDFTFESDGRYTAPASVVAEYWLKEAREEIERTIEEYLYQARDKICEQLKNKN